jgi:hypothetical protein
MQTVSLRFEESFYTYFQALISSLIRDKKVELTDFISIDFVTRK